MSKIMNYLKENQNDIALAMMSANASMGGAVSDWEQIAQLKERK